MTILFIFLVCYTLNMKQNQSPKDEFKQTTADEREWLKQDKIIYGALAGSALILLQPFLNNGRLDDMAAKVMVIAFAISIPLLAALILLNEEERFRKHIPDSKLVSMARVLGQGGAFVGIVAAFWHVSQTAGICVLVASIFGMAVHSAGYYKLLKENKK